MRIDATHELPFARERVFAAYRDDITSFVDQLANIRSMTVERRTEDGDRVELINVWHGGGDIPKAVRPLMKAEMLAWTDYAVWDAETFVCRWRIETHSFTEAVRCEGETRFVELTPQRTALILDGELLLDLGKIRGIPSILRGSLGKTIETFLAKQIAANMTSVGMALADHIAAL